MKLTCHFVVHVYAVDHIGSLLNDSDKMPGLRVIISMDSLDGPAKTIPGSVASGTVLRTYAKDKGVALYDWAEIEALGTQHGRKHTPASPSDIYTICYTSGTTGLPVSVQLVTCSREQSTATFKLWASINLFSLSMRSMYLPERSHSYACQHDSHPFFR